MYTYTWYQWLLIFYVYCFFGWIFESTYVSLKQRQFVNRGFLRLPMLPLYGTGAVMMLWVSLPLEHNLFLVYISGLVAATILEYATGWAMERLFKMKYWDYSNQRFNLNGYICLSSSIAWGFLTIFLTEVIHPPVERLVLLLHPIPALITVGAVTIMFTADAVQSVRAALDLAKVLDAMTKMRAELDDIQVQMALLKSETTQRVAEVRDEAALRLDLLKSEAAAKAGALSESTVSRMEDRAARLSEIVEDTAERMGELVEDTADKVARTAERLSTFTEDAAAKVSSALAERLRGETDSEQTPDERGAKEAGQRSGETGETRTLAGRLLNELSGRKGTPVAEDVSPAEQERRERLAALSQRLAAVTEKRRQLSSHMGFYRRSLLKGNPSASSSRFNEALRELRESAARKRGEMEKNMGDDDLG